MKITLSQTRLALVVAALAAGTSVYAERGRRFSWRQLQEAENDEYDPEIVGYSARSAENPFGEEANMNMSDEAIYTNRAAPSADNGEGPNSSYTTFDVPEIESENESDADDVADKVLDMIDHDEPIKTGNLPMSSIRAKAEAVYNSLLSGLTSEGAQQGSLTLQSRSIGSQEGASPPTASPTSQPTPVLDIRARAKAAYQSHLAQLANQEAQQDTLTPQSRSSPISQPPTAAPSLPPVPMEKAHPFGGFDDKALNGDYGLVPQGRSNGEEAEIEVPPQPQLDPVGIASTSTPLPPVAKDASSFRTSASSPPRPAAKDASSAGVPKTGVPKIGVPKTSTLPPPRPLAKDANSTPPGPRAKDGGIGSSTPPRSPATAGRFGDIPRSNAIPPPELPADTTGVSTPIPEPRNNDANANEESGATNDSMTTSAASASGTRIVPPPRPKGVNKGPGPRGTFTSARRSPAPKQGGNVQSVTTDKRGYVQSAAKQAYDQAQQQKKNKVKGGSKRKLGRFP